MCNKLPYLDTYGTNNMSDIMVPVHYVPHSDCNNQMEWKKDVGHKDNQRYPRAWREEVDMYNNFR